MVQLAAHGHARVPLPLKLLYPRPGILFVIEDPTIPEIGDDPIDQFGTFLATATLRANNLVDPAHQHTSQLHCGWPVAVEMETRLVTEIGFGERGFR